MTVYEEYPALFDRIIDSAKGVESSVNDLTASLAGVEPEEEEWEEIPDTYKEGKSTYAIDLSAREQLEATAMDKPFDFTEPLKILVRDVLQTRLPIADMGFGLATVPHRLTPHQCAFLLEHRALTLAAHGRINRKLHEDTVMAYASDMETSKFIPHPYGLSFFSDGTLANGYHRCQACIEAGVPFETPLFFGVTLAMVAAMDLGKARTLDDVLKLNGFSVDNMAWRKASGRYALMGSRRIPKLTTDEEVAVMTRFSTAAEFIKEHLGVGGRVGNFRNAPIVAALLRAYYHEDHERLATFCVALRDSVVLNPDTDYIAVPYIRWVNKYYEGKGEIKQENTRDTVYRITQKAVSKFCQGVANKSIGLSKKEKESVVELYPLPENLFDPAVPLRVRCMAKHGVNYQGPLRELREGARQARATQQATKNAAPKKSAAKKRTVTRSNKAKKKRR